MFEFIRIACAVPPVKVADPCKNAVDICRYIALADEKKADVLLFPEMCLTGYSCADLFFQESLLHASLEGLKTILARLVCTKLPVALQSIPISTLWWVCR